MDHGSLIVGQPAENQSSCNASLYRCSRKHLAYQRHPRCPQQADQQIALYRWVPGWFEPGTWDPSPQAWSTAPGISRGAQCQTRWCKTWALAGWNAAGNSQNEIIMHVGCHHKMRAIAAGWSEAPSFCQQILICQLDLDIYLRLCEGWERLYMMQWKKLNVYIVHGRTTFP